MNENTPIKLFFVCPIGFEKIQQDELSFWEASLGFQSESKQVQKGGIEVIAPLNYIAIIPYTKISTRVLLRITEFKVRDFPKLFNKVKKFNWSDYLYKEDVLIKVSLKESRIIHSGKAQDAIQKGIDTWIKGNPRKKIKENTPDQKLYFNIKEDLCVVSMDLCGNDLFRRGTKAQGAIAPIRENLASGLLLWSLNKLNTNQKIDIVDPMCGSGTFIYEAINLYLSNFHKKLSFQFIPLTKKIEKKDAPSFENPFKTYLGIDKNNFFNNKREDLENVQFINSDFSKSLESIPKNSFIIFNPPYGKRIKIKQSLSTYYKEITSKLLDTSPLAIGMIIPEGTLLKFSSKEFKRHSFLFKNGGMKVEFVLFQRMKG